MASSKMYRVTPDCLALVDNMGVMLRNVVPEYLKYVKGDLLSHDLPNQEQFKKWLIKFLEINARFEGRLLDGRPHPKGKDYRASEAELMTLANFGQYLITLHEQAQYRKSGLQPRNKQWTVDLNELIYHDSVSG